MYVLKYRDKYKSELLQHLSCIQSMKKNSYFRWTVKLASVFEGRNSHKSIQKHVILEYSQKYANGISTKISCVYLYLCFMMPFICELIGGNGGNILARPFGRLMSNIVVFKLSFALSNEGLSGIDSNVFDKDLVSAGVLGTIASLVSLTTSGWSHGAIDKFLWRILTIVRIIIAAIIIRIITAMIDGIIMTSRFILEVSETKS